MDTVDRYFEAWNARDRATQLRAVQAAFVSDARYLAPDAEARGHDGVAEMMDAAHRRIVETTPSFSFERASAVDVHHGRLRLAWVLKGAEGAAFMSGVTFAEIDSEGRFSRAVSFYDAAKPAP